MTTEKFTHSHTKQDLRKLARRTLSRLSEEERKSHSASLTEKLAEHIKSRFPSAHRIATFSALPHEPDLSLLPLLLPERQFLFPLVTGPEDMQFHLVSDPTSLQPGAYGIQEPNPQVHASVLAEEIDLILVPGLAFDLRGNRLGQGKGYYDRFLKDKPAIPTIGISFGSQLLPELPAESHDQTVTALATDRGIFPV